LVSHDHGNTTENMPDNYLIQKRTVVFLL